MQHKTHFRLGKRRAISTVVGAFLFIILLMASLGVFVSWMQFQSDYLEVQLEISKKGFDKLREDFSISANFDSANSNRLYVNVTNAGSQHVEIVDLLIVNKSLATRDATRYDIGHDDAFVPISSTIDVLKNQALYMTDGTYDIKIVSVLGTTKTASLTVAASGGTGSGDDPETIEEILKPEFFAKPAVFMAFPNPYGAGKGGDEGYWSMAIVNPTNQTMTVSAVAFHALGDKDTGDKFFKGSTPTMINPTSGWDNVKQMVWWQDLDNPISIPKYDHYNFTVGVEPEKGKTSVHGTPIIATAYTNFGQFATYGHTTGTSDKETVIPNLYLSSSSTDSTVYQAISGVTESVSRTFYVILENTSTESNPEILTGSEILINVPPGFTNIANNTSSSQLDPQSFLIFNDGSTQIPVKLNTDMGASTKWYYSFDATPPDVDNTTFYVFHILGTGKVTDKESTPGELNFGPIAETVVQVCDTGGC